MKKAINNQAAEQNANVPAIIESDDKKMLLVNDSSKAAFSSWLPQTMAEKKAYFNAISSPKFKVGDFINKEINIKHVYAETCNYVSKETGELTSGVRIVLIDNEGNAYNTSSQGIYNALSKVFAIFGTPDTWDEPIPVEIKQITVAKDRKVLTLEMV